MSAHTAGPWESHPTRLKVHDCQFSHQIWSVSPRPSVNEPEINIEGRRIAGCRIGFMVEEQNIGAEAAEANARLIAAAPELLDALKRICNLHGLTYSANDDHFGVARAVIAKAEGHS